MAEEFDTRLKERLVRLEEGLPDMSAKTRGSRPMRLSAVALVLVGVLGVATGAAATSVVFREVSGACAGSLLTRRAALLQQHSSDGPGRG